MHSRPSHREILPFVPSQFDGDEPVDKRTRLWTLRALLAGGSPRFWARRIFRLDEETLLAAGLRDHEDKDDKVADPEMLRARARELTKDLESRDLPRSTTLDVNVGLLGSALNLSQLECEIVTFAVRLATHRGLEGAFEGFDLSCVRRVYQLIALTLGCTVEEIRAALGPGGTLPALGNPSNTCQAPNGRMEPDVAD